MRPHTFARQDRRERAPLLSALPVGRQLCAGNRGNPGNLQGTGMWQPRALAARLRDRDSSSAFSVSFFPRPRLRSAMAQVIPASQGGVLRWSRNLRDRRKAPQLDNLIQDCGITLLPGLCRSQKALKKSSASGCK